MRVRRRAGSIAWALALTLVGGPMAVWAPAEDVDQEVVLASGSATGATTLVEDFEQGLVTIPGGMARCAAPIVRGMASDCFPAPGVQRGVRFSNAPFDPLDELAMVVLGGGASGLVGTQTLTPRKPGDALIVEFPDPTLPVERATFDLWYSGSATATCKITVTYLDPALEPDVDTVTCNPSWGNGTTAPPTVVTRVAPAGHVISSITIEARTASGGRNEMLDNLTFMSPGVSETPTPSPSPTTGTPNPSSTPAQTLVPAAPGGHALGPVPNTRVLKKPAGSSGRTVRVKVRSTVAGSTFQCRLDRQKRFHRCRPRMKLTLKPGAHRLRVRAVGPTGISDPTPVIIRWVTRK